MICRKLFKVGPTSNYTVFRLPCGDKSSVQGFQFYVLKFFLLSKRIFEGFELVGTEQKIDFSMGPSVKSVSGPIASTATLKYGPKI